MRIKFLDRFKKKSNDSEQATLDHLLNFLGIQEETGSAMSEACYFACVKVLSEAIGKLPLRLMKSTPEAGVIPALEHRYYRMLHERPNRFMSSSVFWTYMEYCRNHFGNAYAVYPVTIKNNSQPNA